MYCAARYDRNIPLTRFGTLAKDETTAHLNRARPRTVWLCFGLTHDRAEPIKRLWARSDWPLEERIVAPTTGRVQHLRMTARLCEIANGENAVDPMMIKILAADHARDLPGVDVRRGEFQLDLWREVALKHLTEVQPRDEQLRRQAASRWASLSERYRLFGRPEEIGGVGEDEELGRRRQ